MPPSKKVNKRKASPARRKKKASPVRFAWRPFLAGALGCILLLGAAILFAPRFFDSSEKKQPVASSAKEPAAKIKSTPQQKKEAKKESSEKHGQKIQAASVDSKKTELPGAKELVGQIPAAPGTLPTLVNKNPENPSAPAPPPGAREDASLSPGLEKIFKDPIPSKPSIKTPEVDLRPPLLDPKKPKLAIVIDDLGPSISDGKKLLNLNVPVNMAVMPWQQHTTDICRLAAEKGTPVLLHQPMQPLDARKSPGRGAILVGQSEADIHATLLVNLSQLPCVAGINNHMGSRLTSSSREMSIVLDLVARQGLFFLDSMTSPRSVGAAEAGRAGVTYFRRDIFLDNVRDVKKILNQLRQAERVALHNGEAVAIGHPYPETIRALQLWTSSRDPRIEIIPVTRLTPWYKGQPPVVARRKANKK